LAYSGVDAIRRWLLRGDQAVTDDSTVAHLQEALAKVRERGYAVNLRSERLTAYRQALDHLLREPGKESLRQHLHTVIAGLGAEYELLDENPEHRYAAEMIIAPVFGPDGSVVFAITLWGLDECSGAELRRIASRVVDSGLALTRAIGGRVPMSNVGRSAS
jgi:DNA-binding IclR family transcriptional regulator